MKARSARRSIRVYAASLGEYAPDAAVREGRVEVVLVDERGRRGRTPERGELQWPLRTVATSTRP